MRTVRVALLGLSLLVVFAGSAITPLAQAQVTGRAAVSSQAAQALQLDRAWMTQVAVDPTRGSLGGITLHKGILFVSTRQGSVQAIDAENGAIYWTTRVGNSTSITLAPGANDDYVIVTNGSHLFALERRTGRLVWERRTKSGPSAGPALSETRCYVPMYNGAIEVYRLRDESLLDREPTVFFAAGPSLAPPVIKGDRLFWTSKNGFIYGDDDTSSEIRFRYQTGGPIIGGAAVYKPVKGNATVLGASHDGSVYAVNDPEGILLWRYQADSSIAHTPVIVSDAVYVVSDSGVLSRVDLRTGVALWQASGVRRFMSASATRVYTMDPSGQVLVFDALTGGLAGSAFAGISTMPFVNDQTDRAYIVSASGLIQCLHEQALVQPIMHGPPAPVVTKPATEAAPATETTASPFGATQ